MWLVFDQPYVDSHATRCFSLDTLDDSRFATAPTLHDLGHLIEVDPIAVESTVERWNGYVASGIDADFRGGAALIDRNWGDPALDGTAKTLGPIAVAPFWATRIYAATSGTNGGPVTDTEGRLLDDDDRPIPGLFGAGNATASILGDANPAGGSTLGPTLTPPCGQVGLLSVPGRRRHRPRRQRTPTSAPACLSTRQIFLKTGGETRRTAWHQDASYTPIAGRQQAVVWFR